ncbi:MAG: GlcG/HbpS family heme-binding protein [Thiobacillus sp.]
MKRSIIVVAAAMCVSGIAGAADKEAPVIVSISRLSMDMAVKLAKASIDACRKENVNVAVTVIDRGGHPQVVLRDTLTMDLALPISKQKAYTAMSFNAPTSQLEGRFPGSYSVPKLDSLVVAAGGLPITAGGAIVGGIGVSGAPSGVTDEKCAQAGIDAIKFELETF